MSLNNGLAAQQLTSPAVDERQFRSPSHAGLSLFSRIPQRISSLLKALPSLPSQQQHQQRQQQVAASSSASPSSSSPSSFRLLVDPPLSTGELQRVLTRRLTNLQLPDDAHTIFAESLTSFITVTTSLFAKLHLLNLPPVRDFLTHHPVFQFLILSQLHPFRLLQRPLFQLFRPLHWLLAPFAAFSTPLALHLTVQRILASTLIPAPLRTRNSDTRSRTRTGSTNNSNRRDRRSGRSTRNSRQTTRNANNDGTTGTSMRVAVVETIQSIGEHAMQSLQHVRERTKEHLAHLPSPPEPPRNPFTFHATTSTAPTTTPSSSSSPAAPQPTSLVQQNRHRFEFAPQADDHIEPKHDTRVTKAEEKEHVVVEEPHEENEEREAEESAKIEPAENDTEPSALSENIVTTGTDETNANEVVRQEQEEHEEEHEQPEHQEQKEVQEELEQSEQTEKKESERVVTIGAKGLAAIAHDRDIVARGIALYDNDEDPNKLLGVSLSGVSPNPAPALNPGSAL